MTPRRDAAFVANAIDKTENWVKRNAHRYPHHRAGKTYFWTDDDIAAMWKAMEIRPGQSSGAKSLAPLPASRRRAS